MRAAEPLFPRPDQRDAPLRRGAWWWVGFVSLCVIGFGTRLGGLDELSFYADEETTALAARSLAEDGKPVMPSGMEYRRAIAYTWLNALVAGQMGTDREVSYRVGGAAIGGLAPAALFAVGATFVGAGPAFVAGALLAMSEWHVVFSRMARMYVPFVFFYVLAAASLWRWATTGERRYFWASVLTTAATVSLHLLGLFVVQYAFLPLLFAGAAVVSVWRLTTFAGIAVLAGWTYNKFFVEVPYRSFPGLEVADELSRQGLSTPLPTVGSFAAASVLGGVAAVIGVYVFRRLDRASERSLMERLPDIALTLALATAVGFALMGQVLGAASAVAIGLVLGRGEFAALLWRERVWVGLAGVAAVGWMGWMVSSKGLTAGLKAVAYFPYPYAASLFVQQPLVVALAAAAALGVLFTRGSDVPVRAAAISVLLPILAMGAVSRWGPPRYFFHVYPFVLLLAGLSLTTAVGWLLARGGIAGAKLRTMTLAAVLPIVGSGVLGQHGIPQTARVLTLEHGQPIAENLHMTPSRPDHRTPGLFVRERAAEADVIIAVDVLQQAWYAGRVDYWIRGEADAASYLYRDAGELREIYASARLLQSREDVDRVVEEAADARVWLITSAELELDDELAFNEEQRDLLMRLDGSEVFTGRDGKTRVYCLNCSPPSSASEGLSIR